ncbi:hypothetical protein CR152_26745 [Massilia violaceinigra]|uniref:Uncharacterized protein n=1 Tax=Massilia violaceinigra TaxID=2045208 RepID=A0A2D2DRW2_9BURK|nr:hypothetical protein [Massilia violaceinigra]ATQ77703.1 hypothetical protein CR152_26745 [Massilia violaceinigra]
MTNAKSYRACAEYDKNHLMENVMEVLDKHLLSQLVGGLEVDGGGGGTDSGGWGTPGSIAGLPAGAVEYDLFAVGIQGIQDAVVKIQGVTPILENPLPEIDPIRPGDNVWEGPITGVWVEPVITTFETRLETGIAGMTGAVAGVAATTFLTAAIQGAGYGSLLGPLGTLVGGAIGVGVGIGALYLMERHHQGHFTEKIDQTYIDKDGVRHMKPVTTPGDDSPLCYVGPAGGKVMQMMA